MREPNHAFNKCFYTVGGFLVANRDIFGHLDDLLAARRRGRISPAFAEKIMLSVTQVNDRRYCRYGHLHMALQAGVSEPEIQHLLIGDLGTFPKEESIALAFAQHTLTRKIIQNRLPGIAGSIIMGWRPPAIFSPISA